MDNSQLSEITQEISPLIAPFIPYLLKGAKTLGKGAIERLGELFSEEGWEQAKKLWEKLFPKGVKGKDIEKRLKEYASVENQAQKETLISYELEKALKGLSAQEIASIVHMVSEMKNETNVSIASGKNAFSNIGDISNTTIITGGGKGRKKKK